MTTHVLLWDCTEATTEERKAGPLWDKEGREDGKYDYYYGDLYDLSTEDGRAEAQVQYDDEYWEAFAAAAWEVCEGRGLRCSTLRQGSSSSLHSGDAEVGDLLAEAHHNVNLKALLHW